MAKAPSPPALSALLDAARATITRQASCDQEERALTLERAQRKRHLVDELSRLNVAELDARLALLRTLDDTPEVREQLAKLEAARRRRLR